MSWLQSLDTAVFRWVRLSLSNSLLDQVMPFFAWNRVFVPALIAGAIWLVVKGGIRGRIFVAVTCAIIALGDTFVINTLKHVIERPRPFTAMPEMKPLVGKGGSFSMPSSHTSSWFAAAFLALCFYRKSWRFMFPLAAVIGFSRIYVGAHYPTDVIIGAILGTGYAAAGLVGLQLLWDRIGRDWFPLWWARMPSVLSPEAPEDARPPGFISETPTETASAGGRTNAPASLDLHWLRLGYLFIAVMLFVRLGYIAGDEIELSEDEAYQWTWSKHLALSYYSKPPMIAYTQFLGTRLWGDTEFGVRFFSPVIAATVSLLVLRFMSRQTSGRNAFLLTLALHAAPLAAAGSILMTIDPLSVLFWTAAMLAGWRAVNSERAVKPWLWTGLFMGLGLLSKYTALFQLACWAVFFGLWPAARRHLRSPGPWLALLVVAVCAMPILIWNAQHGWITFEHVAQNAKLDKPWRFTLRYFGEFIGSEAGLLNPVFFLGIVCTCVAFWKSHRGEPVFLFLFSMGAPLFLGYWIYALHSRVLPNWIAPAIVPLFCLMCLYWQRRNFALWLTAGLALGLPVVILLHDTDMLRRLTGYYLPAKLDPLRRVRAWSTMAKEVNLARRELAGEGKEAFVIGAHYGLVGELSFYMPEAKKAIESVPLVYYRSSPRPGNQYYFWPSYREQRPGQNAIYVHETEKSRPPPDSLLAEFESVESLGVRSIKYRGREFRHIELFACRNLKPR
ncbi:MAG TPA: glycosyltransferase family 39 protein [Candidatus Binatia bacterium]|nr:glycosyltransferase family 39 protein [Candidatus Binatia bacterium]